MAKSVLILILTFQGAFGAPTKYDDDFTFVNLWNEIELEIKDIVTHLKDGNDEYAQKVEHQCEVLAQVIGKVIDQLHQETMDHEQGDIIFKRVMYVFQQIYSSLKRSVLFSDNLDRSKLIYALETVTESMQQLVFIAKTYCPQLRALLRTILVDFLQFARDFRTDNEILEKDPVIYESPNRMVSQIQVITKQFTDLLKECEHIEEMRMVLRGYIRYVEEIIHKLENKTTLGETEIDRAVQSLADELRMMFVPLMKMIMHEQSVDVEAFKTNLIAHFFAINTAFKNLVDLDTDSCPTTAKEFIEKIIYFYYYTIKQTHFEVRTAYKNSFYGRNYHEEFFLENSDSDLKQLLADSDKFEIESPEELVMRIQKLVQRFNAEDWGTKPVAYYARDLVKVLEYVADKIAKEVRIRRLIYTESVMNKFYEDLKSAKLALESLLGEGGVTKAEFVRCVQGIFVELYKIVIVEKTQDNGYEHLLLKDICVEFYNFLNNLFYQAEIYDEQHRVDLSQANGVKEESGRYQRQVVRQPKFVFIKVIKYE